MLTTHVAVLDVVETERGPLLVLVVLLADLDYLLTSLIGRLTGWSIGLVLW